MAIVTVPYNDSNAVAMFVEAMHSIFANLDGRPVVICIGSGRHILDCLGPLTGTMLCELHTGIPVYGTLERPIHARNLVGEIARIKQEHPGSIELAVDAAVGEPWEIGHISLKDEALAPGRAFYRRLPDVGDLSITGIVDSRENQRKNRGDAGQGLAHVYGMAKTISSFIGQWYKEKL